MTDLMTRSPEPDSLIEEVVIQGNLAHLTSAQRAAYYHKVCASLGLNPYTRPFEYLTLQQGKLTLYARKDATDQLRSLRRVSLTITARETVGDLYVVTARAQLPDGRTDEEIGAVPIKGLGGEALANAYMKASTKAKRRVTLSICGLGMLDESETESIPGAQRFEEPDPGPSPRMAELRANLESIDDDEPATLELAERRRQAAAMNPPNRARLAEDDAGGVPGDDVDSLTGEALADACDRMRRRLGAANLPHPPIPNPRTVRNLREWWHQGAALLSARG